MPLSCALAQPATLIAKDMVKRRCQLDVLVAYLRRETLAGQTEEGSIEVKKGDKR
jgi:hypothetical protein